MPAEKRESVELEPNRAALTRLRALAAEREEGLNDPQLAPTDGPFDATWEEARDVERGF